MNISSNCSTSPTSYFASSDFVLKSVFLVTVITLPFIIYGFYCILKVTPKHLIGTKWVLLNLHIWTSVVFIIMNVLSIPFMFFPTISGVMLGYGESLGIPPLVLTYSIQSVLCVFISAGIALLENRQNLLDTKLKIRETWQRVFMNFLNCSVAFMAIIPLYFENINNEEMFENVLEVIPCPAIEFFTSRVFFVSRKPLLMTILMGFKLFVYSPQVIFYNIHTWYHLVYAQGSKVSPETKKMQWRFFVGSFFQVSIPVAVIFGPVLYIWFSINTRYYNQGKENKLGIVNNTATVLNNLVTLVVSFHGLSGTCCMILIHGHYRTHFVKLITLGKVDLSKESSAVAPLIQSVVQNVGR